MAAWQEVIGQEEHAKELAQAREEHAREMTELKKAHEEKERQAREAAAKRAAERLDGKERSPRGATSGDVRGALTGARGDAYYYARRGNGVVLLAPGR